MSARIQKSKKNQKILRLRKMPNFDISGTYPSNQGWARGLGSHGIFVPGLGTGIGTDSPGTLGTGKNIAWTVPGQKILKFWLSQSRPMGHKSLRLSGLGQKSLGQSRDFELWDSSPWDKNPWEVVRRRIICAYINCYQSPISKNSYLPL